MKKLERSSCVMDATGFDYMANSGQEEKDRDYVGIALAVGIMAFVTICQYCGLL